VHSIVLNRRREQQQREREAQEERVRLRNEQLDALRQVSLSLTYYDFLPSCLNISHSSFCCCVLVEHGSETHTRHTCTHNNESSGMEYGGGSIQIGSHYVSSSEVVGGS
jgi:hypothetical protein